MNSLQPSAGGKPPSQSRSFSDILKGPSPSFIPKTPCLFRGKPAVSFSEEDIQKYSEPFKFTLIGKFSNGRPPMEILRKSFHSIGFSGTFTLGLINSRHILIRFDHQEDYLRCWKRGYWTIEGLLMRVIKWHPNFSVDNESPLVPVWINLPLLPIHLYNKEALFSIARLIGEPLKIDAATEALSRPSQARVCIELDLMKDRVDEVHISLGSFSYWQKIEYENVPHYCSTCFKIGHQKESCRKNENRKTSTDTNQAANIAQAISQGNVRKEYRPIQRANETVGPSGSNEDDDNIKISAPSPAKAAPEATVNILAASAPADPTSGISEFNQDDANIKNSAEATPHATAIINNVPTPADPPSFSDIDIPQGSPQDKNDLPNSEISAPTMAAAPQQIDSAISSSSYDPVPLREASASSNPIDYAPAIHPMAYPTNEDLIMQDTKSCVHSNKPFQDSLKDDIFELGEIPNADLLHSSDVEEHDLLQKQQFPQVLSEHTSKQINQCFNDPPNACIAPTAREKTKKKHSQFQSERILTRKSSRAPSQSSP